MKISADNQRILLLIGLCLIAYSRIYTAPFIFDDFECIYRNPLIRDFKNYFNHSQATETFGAHAYLLKDTLNSFFSRPLSYLTFSLNYHVHGVTVTGYHIVNVFIHVLNVSMLYLLVMATAQLHHSKVSDHPAEDLTQNIRRMAFLTASIFAVHPLMTNSVTYIVQRMNSLVALFYLGTVLLYARSCCLESTLQRVVTYCLSIVFCGAAMLTKESAFTIPLMLLVYDLIFCQGQPWQRIRRLLPFGLTLVIIPLNVIGLYNAEAVKTGGIVFKSLNAVNFTQVSSWEYLLTQFRVVMFYLRLLLVPFGLSLEHDFRVSHALFETDVILSLLFHLILLGYGAYLIAISRTHGRYSLLNVLAGFGIIWFYCALLVESSVIPLDVMAVEYRTYLPSFGIFLFTVCSCMKLQEVSACFKNRWLENTVWGAIIGSLLFVTIMRNEVLQKPDLLWTQTISLYPRLARPYASLAQHYIHTGNVQEAIRTYDRAIQINPNVPRLYLGRGKAYMLLKKYDSAIPDLYSALHLNPDLKEAHQCLDLSYRQLRQQAQTTITNVGSVNHGE